MDWNKLLLFVKPVKTLSTKIQNLTKESDLEKGQKLGLRGFSRVF